MSLGSRARTSQVSFWQDILFVRKIDEFSLMSTNFPKHRSRLDYSSFICGSESSRKGRILSLIVQMGRRLLQTMLQLRVIYPVFKKYAEIGFYDISNADETDVDYCMSANRTICFTFIKATKKCKKRLTLLFGRNTSGTEKPVLRFISNAPNSTCFQMSSGRELDVDY